MKPRVVVALWGFTFWSVVVGILTFFYYHGGAQAHALFASHP